MLFKHHKFFIVPCSPHKSNKVLKCIFYHSFIVIQNCI